MFGGRKSKLSRKVHREALRLIQRVERGEIPASAFWKAHGTAKLEFMLAEIDRLGNPPARDAIALESLRTEIELLLAALDRLSPESLHVSQPDCLRSLILSGVIALGATGELRGLDEYLTTYANVLELFGSAPASSAAALQDARSDTSRVQGHTRSHHEPRQEFVVSLAGQADFNDIEQAVKQAPEWATIRVRPGVYPAGFLLLKPLRIIADGPPGTVVIESSTASAVVSFAPEGLVQGFTIKGNGGLGGGTILTSSRAVWVQKGAVVFEDCNISTNGAVGVFVTPGHASPVIRRCKVHGASLTGIHFEAQAGGQVSGLVEDCDIFGNGRSGIVILSGAAPRIVGNRIFDNGLVGIGAAEGGKGAIVDNHVWNHQLDDIKVDSTSGPVVANNHFTSVSASAQGRSFSTSPPSVGPLGESRDRVDVIDEANSTEASRLFDLERDLPTVVRRNRIDLHPVLDAAAALRRTISPRRDDAAFGRFLARPQGKRLADLMARLESEFAGPRHGKDWPEHHRWLHGFDSILAYALTNSHQRFEYGNAVFAEIVEAFEPEHRRQLAFDVFFALEPTAEQVCGMLPFMFVDPDYAVVSTAALNFLYLYPTLPGEPMAGVRQLLGYAREYNRTDEDDERVAAWIGATLVLGDRRALPILNGSWDLLRLPGQVVLAEAGAQNGVPNAAQIEYFLLWLEATANNPKAALSPAIALSTLAPRVAEAGVADFYRDLPAPHSFAVTSQQQQAAGTSLPTWSNGRVLNEGATQMLAHWDAFDYARIVAPRIDAAMHTLGDAEVSQLLANWRSLASDFVSTPPAPRAGRIEPDRQSQFDHDALASVERIMEELTSAGLPKALVLSVLQESIKRTEQFATDRRASAATSVGPSEHSAAHREIEDLEARAAIMRRGLELLFGNDAEAAVESLSRDAIKSPEEMRRFGLILLGEIEESISRGRAIASSFSDPLHRDEYLQQLHRLREEAHEAAGELNRGDDLLAVIDRIYALHNRVQR